MRGASVWFGAAHAATDAERRFAVAHLPPGPWRVSVQDDAGQRKASVSVADVSGEGVAPGAPALAAVPGGAGTASPRRAAASGVR